MTIKIDPKLLKGLKFHGVEAKEETVDGRKKTKYYPIERDVTQDDVLAVKDYGDRTVIVVADGKKYSIPKGEEKTKEK